METLPISQGGRRYGYKRDLPDFRDLGMARLTRAKKTNPSKIDLEKLCGPVKDQGDLGSCTAFAGCGMREFLWRRDSKSKSRPPIFSPMFLYYKERELDGNISEDAGSYGRTSVQVMQKIGVCLESTDPYEPKNFRSEPTPEEVAEALKYRAGGYHRLAGVDDMKSCLASKYVFVVGFTVYESFETGSWTTMPIPKHGEQILGGHEVLFIGYDDSKNAFKVRNSWGNDWAEKGNFWFPYTAAADSRILQDAWIQHLGVWK